MTIESSSRRGAKISWIVVHYPALFGQDAQWLKGYFNRDKVTESAHYAVSDTQTVSIVPCDRVANHCKTYGLKTYCGATNRNSIGVDLCNNKMSTQNGTSVDDNDWFIRHQTLSRGAYLIAYLMKRHNIPLDHVVRHYDVTHKLCPRPLVGNDINTYYGVSGNQKWEEFKELIAQAYSSMNEQSQEDQNGLV